MISACVLPPPPQASIAVAGEAARFAVRRIFCVGRNYAEHAREMRHDPDSLFFFTRPADAVQDNDPTVRYPPMTEDLHHEAELVVAIGTGGIDIAEDAALGHIWGYAAGNDLTRRDRKAEAKELRRPWGMAKGLDRPAIVGPLHPASNGHGLSGAIRRRADGELRQEADLSDLLWSVPEILAQLSRHVALMPGDLIFTGTPAKIGPIDRRQMYRVEIEGLAPAEVTLV